MAQRILEVWAPLQLTRLELVHNTNHHASWDTAYPQEQGAAAIVEEREGEEEWLEEAVEELVDVVEKLDVVEELEGVLAEFEGAVEELE